MCVFLSLGLYKKRFEKLGPNIIVPFSNIQDSYDQVAGNPSNKNTITSYQLPKGQRIREQEKFIFK